MNIHQKVRAEIAKAGAMIEDGAFHTASRILRDLARDLESHAQACDEALDRHIEWQKEQRHD
jgi:hypothetical protein